MTSDRDDCVNISTHDQIRLPPFRQIIMLNFWRRVYVIHWTDSVLSDHEIVSRTLKIKLMQTKTQNFNSFKPGIPFMGHRQTE